MNRIVAGDFSDPTNERIIYLSAAGLAIVGVALLVGTILWWRRGRQEHPALSPLEVMGARAWAKAPEGDRRRRLEQARLSGGGDSADGVGGAEPVDLKELVRSVPQAFDDLREPGAAIELPAAADPVPVPVEAAKPDEVVEPAKAEAPVEPVKPVDQPEQVKPVEKPDPDATSISMERPEEAFETSASGKTEPSG